jgi:N-acyl amino acid synthase of PEP-CTERM/exosortase system
MLATGSFVPDQVNPAASRCLESDELRLLYWKYFQIVDADTPQLLQRAFRLRYQVYCIEHPFEPSSPSELESDVYDGRAGHSLLMHRLTGLLAGTVRMVRPNPNALDRSFAIQEVCTEPVIRDIRRFPLDSMGEISRFCVPKDFRRRVQDRQLIDLPANSDFDEKEWRRVIPNMTLGLIQWLVKFSHENDFTHWCAVMEPTLLRLLARLGIHFEPLGDVIDFHGRRQPCYCELESMLDRVHRERSDVWSVIAQPPI